MSRKNKRVDGGDVSSIPKKGDSHTTFNSRKVYHKGERKSRERSFGSW